MGNAETTQTNVRSERRAIDAAQYLIDKHGALAQIQLHKLLYYCQAWSLVWDARPLFNDAIEAWVNGPVVPSFWRRHAYQYLVRDAEGDAARLDATARDTIDIIWQHYGHLSPAQLIRKTHSEKPWREARKNLSPSERGNTSISWESMERYYRSIARE